MGTNTIIRFLNIGISRLNTKDVYLTILIFMILFTIGKTSIVTADTTLSIIDYFGPDPKIQFKDYNITIICIIKENIEIQTVELIIYYPNGYNLTEEMSWCTDGKFIFNKLLNTLGNYSFNIIVKDKEENIIKTKSKYFWVTLNKNDLDNDGMPNWWEKDYGLDFENPKDASENNDGDEYTNLMEYKINTNPLKNNFLQNVAYRLRHNSIYLTVSIFFFLMIVIMTKFGLRRRVL